MTAVTELATAVGTRAACLALWVPRGSYYRDRRSSSSPVQTAPRPRSGRALAAAERETILTHLHQERFQDCSPAAVYATLLDEGQYHCSIRTMYRLLAAQGESRERRDQLTHPPYQKPELLATAPNLELGHHQTFGSGEMDLLLPLRDPRCVQSLRHRLDDRHARECRTGQAAHPGQL
jgi:putative transposase